MAGLLRGRKGPALIILLVIVVIPSIYGVRRFALMRGGAGAADSSAADSAAADSKSKNDKSKTVEAVPVEISQAGFKSISSYYQTTATLQPERKVEIVAKITGEIVNIRAEEGDMVQKGALLCELNDEEQRIALDAERIKKEKQKAEFKRFQEMYKKNLISDKEYSDAKYNYETAENQLEAAALKYGYTKIRAPFTGVITKRLVDVGLNVGLGTKLLEIADIDPLLIKMYLPENEMAVIKPGQVIHITPDTDPKKVFKGKIIRSSPEVDDRTGTVKVTAQVEGIAMPGSFVRIKIVTATHDSSLAIPREGLVNDAGETFVFVAEADTVRKTRILLGFEDEHYAEVLQGVELDDSIVVVGQGALKQGTKITIISVLKSDDVSADEDASK